MDEAEKVLERVDSMHLEFAKRAAVSIIEIIGVYIKLIIISPLPVFHCTVKNLSYYLAFQQLAGRNTRRLG